MIWRQIEGLALGFGAYLGLESSEPKAVNLGFRVKDLGFRVLSLEFRVYAQTKSSWPLSSQPWVANKIIW